MMGALALAGGIAKPAQAYPLDFPTPRSHPLPPTLSRYSPPHTEHYFEHIKPSHLGYLLWSDFPITVYIETAPEMTEAIAKQKQMQVWGRSVRAALQDWSLYLPLVETSQVATADIAVYQREPPLGSERDPHTGLVRLGRARNAQTRYSFYLTPESPPRLKHRMAIEIKPGLGEQSILATARHELGHALGLWGHSPYRDDSLYFSSIHFSPPISPRDLNTLILLYQQPTQIGWPLPR